MTYLDVALRAEPDLLKQLPSKLRELSYTEEKLTQFLQREPSQLKGSEYLVYLQKCREDQTGFGVLVSLLLMGQATSRKILVNLFGESLVKALRDCNVLIDHRGAWGFYAVIYPLGQHYFFTDQWIGETGTQAPGKVYELGPDSYLNARLTPRNKVKNALDLCTGSGIHAVLSAHESARSVAVDINPRALAYTELNAALHGVNCSAIESDLYTEIGKKKFDLITVNPPFVPSPDRKVLVHRSAGDSGEEVPQRLVRGLPKHLRKNGLFSMVLEYPVYGQDNGYLDRLESWIGETEGWGIVVLDFDEFPLELYVRGHLPRDNTADDLYLRYLKSYQELGITRMMSANVFIKRLKKNQPNWKVVERLKRPTKDVSDKIGEWLEHLVAYQDPDWSPKKSWKPHLSPHYTCLWRDWNHERGYLEAADSSFFQMQSLSGDESELLNRMKSGSKTVKELQREWSKSEDSFLSAFRALGCKGALE